MQIAHTQTQTSRRAARRIAYSVVAALLLTAALAGAIRHGGAWWQFSAFIIGPDVALLLGMSSTLAKGQLHPRAVPLYNALHSYGGPALLAVAAIVVPFSYVIGALAWAFHISWDRALGYPIERPKSITTAMLEQIAGVK